LIRAALGADDPEVPVWASYTDVAMNVLVVLLLYLFAQAVYSTITSAQLVRVRQEQKEMEQAVMDALPPELRRDVTVAEDGQLMRYRFADQVLFDSGQARLKPSGEEILSDMARAFSTKVGTYSQIQVEGHTDDRPIHTAQFDSNWELSSERATSVVRFLQDRSNLDPKLMSATGYSQYRPLSPANTDRDRQLNRRIEVVLVYTLQNGRAAK
jgi:chemotaxis protein MotB